MLADHQILKLCQEQKMISPFTDRSHSTNEDGDKIVSYGLSSYGYDIRLGSKVKYLDNTGQTLSPHYIATEWEECYVGWDDYFTIRPHSFILGESVERFKIPRDILCICFGKSTYARVGISINITPLEPEWEGVLTIEIANNSSNPVNVYYNEGIAQLIFLQANELCTTSYADKGGKYQNQTGVTTAKLVGESK